MSLYGVPVLNGDLLLKENYILSDNNHPNPGRGINIKNLVFDPKDLGENKILLINKDLLEDAKQQIRILGQMRRTIYLH